MECQVEKLDHFRQFILFEFNTEATAARAAINICAVYGFNDIGERTARKWFSRFTEVRFVISDTPRSERSSGFDEYRLNTLIHNDPSQYTRELANVMNCDHPTIVRHLHSMGNVQKSSVCLPYALSQNHKHQLVDIRTSILARRRLTREQHRPLLSCIVTCDEKWCLYDNTRKRKEWFCPNKRRICLKCSYYSTWHSIF